MRRGLAATVLVACSFSTTIPEENPGMPIDARPIDARPIDAKPLPACPSAPSGCVQFDCLMNPTSCYYYCASTETSGTANNNCKTISSGACLATLNDANESACILAAAGGTSLVYIGLVQGGGAEPSGGWGWYCGTSAFALQWDSGEPNNATDVFGNDEDCGATKPNGTWVDVGCGEDFRYVCEAPRPTQ